jgi:aminoglycoside phosphotransferase (APT) family kinase protein
MAYVVGNPKSKKMVKQWLAEGKEIQIFQPGLGDVPFNGTVSIEGPHYPKPHTWYGTATIVEGTVTKIV